MSTTEKDSLERSYPLALYRDLEFGYTAVCAFYGENDQRYHSQCVRISEPVELRFHGLASDEVIQNAIATLDAAEQEARVTCEERIARLREQRAGLLALTHQPEVV